MRPLPHILVSILLVIAAGQAPAGEPRWLEAAQAGTFLYRADFKLGERDRLLAELARLRSELFETLALPASSETIELYLFRDEKSYREYLTKRFGDLPKRRALYIKAGGPGMVFAYQGEQFLIDVRHETTHALLHSVLDEIPLWLDEGLAEYFEVAAAERSSLDPHFRDLRRQLAERPLAPLEALEHLDDSTGMGRDDYLAAWSWTHFLLQGPPAGRDELASYVRALKSGGPTGPLSAPLRRQLPNLERLLDAHFREALRQPPPR
jgi:hypothetical protein